MALVLGYRYLFKRVFHTRPESGIKDAAVVSDFKVGGNSLYFC